MQKHAGKLIGLGFIILLLLVQGSLWWSQQIVVQDLATAAKRTPQPNNSTPAEAANTTGLDGEKPSSGDETNNRINNTSSSSNSDEPATDDIKSRVLTLINQHRQKTGCPALVFNPQLNQAASQHSQSMGTYDFFDHVGIDGTLPWDRIQAAGYDFQTAAENIAYGHATPDLVVKSWLGSPEHRENIENCRWVDTGIGYTYNPESEGQYYWVQDFATPKP